MAISKRDERVFAVEQQQRIKMTSKDNVCNEVINRSIIIRKPSNGLWYVFSWVWVWHCICQVNWTEWRGHGCPKHVTDGPSMGRMRPRFIGTRKGSEEQYLSFAVCLSNKSISCHPSETVCTSSNEREPITNKAHDRNFVLRNLCKHQNLLLFMHKFILLFGVCVSIRIGARGMWMSFGKFISNKRRYLDIHKKELVKL